MFFFFIKLKTKDEKCFLKSLRGGNLKSSLKLFLSSLLFLSLVLSGCGTSSGGDRSSQSTKKETSVNSTLVEVSKLDGNTISYGSQAYFYISLKQKPSSDVTIALKTSDPNEAILANDVIALKFTPANYQNRKVVLQGVKKDRKTNLQEYKLVFYKAKSDDAIYAGLKLDDIHVKSFYLKADKIEDTIFIPNKENTLKIQTTYNGKHSLEYKLSKAPKGMSIDKNGIISWTPSNEFAGKSANVNVEIKDKLFSEKLSFDINVTKPKILETKVLSNKEIEVVDTKSDLKGLKIEIKNDTHKASDIKLASIEEKAIRAVPDFIKRLSDIFISKEPIKGEVAFKIPSSALPKGVKLGDIDLYVLSFVDEVNKEIWSPVAIDKKYYEKNGELVLEIVLNGIVGEFFIGVPKDKISSIKTRSIKKRNLTKQKNGISCENNKYDSSIICKKGSNTITVEGFYDKKWELTDPQDLVSWLIDAQKGFESLNMKYKDTFRVKIHQMPRSSWLGFVTGANNENRNVLHITSGKNDMDLIKATAYHEYFHHSQAKTGKNLMKASDYMTINSYRKSGRYPASKNYKTDRQFFIEGGAQWFEDYVNDGLNSYGFSEWEFHNILNSGLINTQSGEEEERPYLRFAYLKMLKQYCSLDNYIADLMVYPFNLGFLDHFKSYINKNCNLPNINSSESLSGFEKSLHFYQNVVMNKQDMSLLDNNEPKKLPGFRYITSSIGHMAYNDKLESKVVAPYGAYSFKLNLLNDADSGYVRKNNVSYDGQKVFLSFTSDKKGSISFSNKSLNIKSVKKGKNEFEIMELSNDTFVSIVNETNENLTLSNVKILSKSKEVKLASAEILFNDESISDTVEDNKQYKLHVKGKYTDNTFKDIPNKDIKWSVSNPHVSFENGILHVGDLTGESEIILKAKISNVEVVKIIHVKDIYKPNVAPITKSASYSMDQNESLEIKLQASDENGDKLSFEVSNPQNGEIKQDGINVTYTPHHGFIGEDSFTFKANDGKEYSSEATISINVKKSIPKDTKAPVFGTPATLEVDENQKEVVTIIAKDASEVTYFLSGLDKEHFSLDAHLGKLAFKNAPDYETKHIYKIKITAVDSSGNKSTQDFTINVKDADENAPVFQSQSTFVVFENNATTFTIKANDDSGAVEYILDGVDKGYFDFNQSTGELSFKKAPDYETKNSYKLTIIAKDKYGNKSTQDVTINVKDVDESLSAEILGILKTGQTTSYKDFDDGYYQKGADRKYTRADGIVTDHITKLMWQDDYSDNGGNVVSKSWIIKANWDAKKYDDTSGDTATTYCQNLTLGGYSNWRLPTQNELLSIVDYGQNSPSINAVFINVGSSTYWTSTTSSKYSENAWVINFKSGDAFTHSKKFEPYVRCVRNR